jgi:hypothetical protein
MVSVDQAEHLPSPPHKKDLTFTHKSGRGYAKGKRFGTLLADKGRERRETGRWK